MPTTRIRDLRRRAKSARRMFVDTPDAGRVNITTYPVQSSERQKRHERFTVETERR